MAIIRANKTTKGEIMDDFNNFFDDQRGNSEPPKTPIYHTPDPKPNNKNNVATVICIVMAVVMCLAIIINVLVLSTLKESIAKEYAQSMKDQAQDQYDQAINDVLNNSDIVDDIKDALSGNIGNTTGIGAVANEYASSVARLYMYQTEDTSYLGGVASAFLITDTNDNGTKERYLVTNAHCVIYTIAKPLTSPFPQLGVSYYEYAWTKFSLIKALFDGSDTAYTLEIVAFGSYYDDNLGHYDSSLPDLAILKVVGEQPSNQAHPSLKIAGSSYTIERGVEVANIGNPKIAGNANSISTGVISQLGIKISDWGAGELILTDAAVNGGNSGGPMIDKNGVVLGVVESKLVSEDIDNMGFAVSAKTLREFIAWVERSENITIDCTYA